MIASGATTPNNRVADDQGFLRQWSKVAKERKLQRLYIGEPSAEAVAAQMPDLILISATGGDSALALYDQLSTIAPTLIINYDDKSWQSLLTQLGEITGHEKQAAERIAQFDKQLAAAKEQIKLPPQPVTALVYTAAAHSANLWTPESAQGQMLEQLGFTLAKLPAGLNASQSQGKRHDIIQLGGENLAAGLNGESLFLFAGDQKDADAIYANPLLAHLPAVQNKQVYALGTETFRRVEFYSNSLFHPTIRPRHNTIRPHLYRFPNNICKLLRCILISSFFRPMHNSRRNPPEWLLPRYNMPISCRRAVRGRWHVDACRLDMIEHKPSTQ